MIGPGRYVACHGVQHVSTPNAVRNSLTNSGGSLSSIGTSEIDLFSLRADGSLSEEGIRIIQALQQRLQRARGQLRAAEAAGARVVVAAEERTALSHSLNDRQNQVTTNVDCISRSHDQALAREAELESQLQSLTEEIAAAKAYSESLVSQEEDSALSAQLESLTQHLEAAVQEDRGLRRQIEEVEAAQRRRVRARLKRDKEEAERREIDANAAFHGRRIEARRVSERAVAEQRGRYSFQQVDKVAQLRCQKESVELELRKTSSQNADLERQLEAMRARNRQLEAQERRVRQELEQQEQVFRTELRKRAQQNRVLMDLMRETEAEREDDGGQAESEGARAMSSWSLADVVPSDDADYRSWASLSPPTGWGQDAAGLACLTPTPSKTPASRLAHFRVGSPARPPNTGNLADLGTVEDKLTHLALSLCHDAPSNAPRTEEDEPRTEEDEPRGKDRCEDRVTCVSFQFGGSHLESSQLSLGNSVSLADADADGVGQLANGDANRKNRWRTVQ